MFTAHVDGKEMIWSRMGTPCEEETRYWGTVKRENDLCLFTRLGRLPSLCGLQAEHFLNHKRASGQCPMVMALPLVRAYSAVIVLASRIGSHDFQEMSARISR